MSLHSHIQLLWISAVHLSETNSCRSIVRLCEQVPLDPRSMWRQRLRWAKGGHLYVLAPDAVIWVKSPHLTVYQCALQAWPSDNTSSYTDAFCLELHCSCNLNSLAGSTCTHFRCLPILLPSGPSRCCSHCRSSASCWKCALMEWISFSSGPMSRTW